MRLSPFEPLNVSGKVMPIGAYTCRLVPIRASALGPVMFLYILSWPVACHCIPTYNALPLSKKMAISNDERRWGIIRYRLAVKVTMLLNAALPLLLRSDDAAQCWI